MWFSTAAYCVPSCTPLILCLFPICFQCLRMSKRNLFVRLVPCRCLRGEEEAVTSLDYSHCSLETVPKEIFSFEKTLQELYLDANQIEELPKVRSRQMSRGRAWISPMRITPWMRSCPSPFRQNSNCSTARCSTGWACRITTWPCCRRRSQTSSISGSLMSAKTVRIWNVYIHTERVPRPFGWWRRYLRGRGGQGHSQAGSVVPIT